MNLCRFPRLLALGGARRERFRARSRRRRGTFRAILRTPRIIRALWLAHGGAPGSAHLRQGAGLHGQGHAGISARMPLSAPPPLDPSRKISEQSCSRPIALDGGNLRCKVSAR